MRVILMVALALLPIAAHSVELAKRLDEAATILSEDMATPDKGVSIDLLAKASCSVVVPGVKKLAFVVGRDYGSGYLSCRNKSQIGWSALGSVRIEGGSVGSRISGSETDLIMLVMNSGGVDKLLSDKFTLGADASVAVGPARRALTA